jgi:hypothetical protein
VTFAELGELYRVTRERIRQLIVAERKRREAAGEAPTEPPTSKIDPIRLVRALRSGRSANWSGVLTEAGMRRFRPADAKEALRALGMLQAAERLLARRKGLQRRDVSTRLRAKNIT